jgi:membrane-bound serine protease (ClpP class)
VKRFLAFLIVVAGLAAAASARADTYVHIGISGVINPVEARYVRRALDVARDRHASFVVVSIDTPGGLVTSMEQITNAITNADVPVVGFVEPTSAQATSAGAFILLATDVAAMAPHTRVGASHPVGSEGKDLPGVMNEKATNSLVSLAKSLAERRGRPESFAESIVRKSASYTAEEAKAAGAVEILAVDRDDLLQKLDGRHVSIHGRDVVFHSAGAAAIELPLSLPERILDHLADPTIASLLLSLGMLGILYELSSPGIGAAGIVGVVSLLTGLFAMSVLPIELSGVLLLVVGFVAIGIEIKLQSHGALAVGGVVSILIGALMLVDRASYFGGAQQVDWRVFLPFVALVTAGVVMLASIAIRSQRAKAQTGVEALVGRRGRTKTTFRPAGEAFEGTVFVDGARWAAVAPAPLADGVEVEVTGVLAEPVRLEVREEKKEKGTG